MTMDVALTPVDRGFAAAHLPSEVFQFCEKNRFKFDKTYRRKVDIEIDTDLRATQSTLRFQRNSAGGIGIFIQLHSNTAKIRELVSFFQDRVLERESVMDENGVLHDLETDPAFLDCLTSQEISVENPALIKHYQFFHHTLNKDVIKTIRFNFLNETPTLLERVYYTCLNCLSFSHRYKFLYLLDAVTCQSASTEIRL